MPDSLQSLRAEINLSGLSRREAAAGLYLSLSALNRKLRGEIRITEEEKEKGGRSCRILCSPCARKST